MKEIILEQSDKRLRAALLENGVLMEVYEQEGEHSRLTGNIYKGRVENILPGMQAAFVDIGLERNAFLYVGDAVPARYQEDENTSHPSEARVELIIKPRQELLVQILKEAVGTKGARVSTNLAIAGRYVVFMPNLDYVGVSRKIQEGGERERLRTLAALLKPPGTGIIVRTLAQGLSEAELEHDISHLAELWADIQSRLQHVSVPGLVYQDLGLVERLVRDLIDRDVERIIADQDRLAAQLRASLREIGHAAAKSVFVDMRGKLFERHEVDYEIKKALQPKVWLKSGGYLVIHQTEALTTIDVNTGKYVGKHSLEETVLHTNLEAAAEIPRQLRLRNLGGIIIIDFIDMALEEDKNRIIEVLKAYCDRDKTKCDVLGLTRLGLVEMTRKKVGQTLAARYTKPCPACGGSGRQPG